MEERGFIDYGQNKHRFPSGFEHHVLIGNNDCKVEINRHLQFFYVGQDVTLGKLREFFTEKALLAYEHDNFIKIIY